MTVTPAIKQEVQYRTGLSSDIKPIVQDLFDREVRNGDIFTESDTKHKYEFILGEWIQTHAEGLLLTADTGLMASLGLTPCIQTINKYGEASDCDSGVPTDIWDGADGTISTDIWVPPKQARVHQLTSASANDTADGTGARTIRVDYLPDWSTKEVSVVLSLAGAGNVATPASVIINRMEVLTWGSGGLNAGIITATADVDGTVSAAILAGHNQTMMAIYGVPSTQKLRVSSFQASIVRSGGSVITADGGIFAMRDPAINAANNKAWTHKEDFILKSSLLPWTHDYNGSPKRFDGPCILKMQITTSADNTKTLGFFDGKLITT